MVCFQTKLCNTAIDNPTHRSKDTVIDGILEYLETDTIWYGALGFAMFCMLH